MSESIRISLESMRQALAYALDVCPKSNELPGMAYVAIVPDPDRKRTLVAATDGIRWVGSYIPFVLPFKVALTRSSAVKARDRLAFELKNRECPQLAISSDHQLWWFVESEDQENFRVNLVQFTPPWDVKSKVPPSRWPTSWEPPRVPCIVSGTPTAFSSSVFQLAKHFKGAHAQFWTDAKDHGRLEFVRYNGDLLAYVVALSTGAHVAEALPTNTNTTASLETNSTTENPTDRPTGEPIVPPGEVKGEKIKLPESFSEAFIETLKQSEHLRRVASALDIAKIRGELVKSNEKEVELEQVQATFWKAYEALSKEDQELLGKLQQNPEVLHGVLETVGLAQLDMEHVQPVQSSKQLELPETKKPDDKEAA